MNRAQRRAKKSYQKVNLGIKTQLIREKAIDIAVQRHLQLQLWAVVVALSEEAGFGKERTQRFLDRIEKVWNEWEQMVQDVDLEYATEKLRIRAEQVSGLKIGYVEDAIRDQMQSGQK